MAAIAAVIFDIGRVLHRWEPARLYERLIPDPAERDAFVRDVVSFAWHAQHDEGRPFAETAAELSARHPEHADLIAAWGPNFLDTLPGPVEGMEELVAEIDAAGIPLYAITNFSGEFFPPFRAREAALFDRFRGIVVSGDEKLIKPDAAIFHLALKRWQLDPAACVFVDDAPANVEGARAVGLHAIHFTNAPALRAELVRLDVLPA